VNAEPGGWTGRDGAVGKVSENRMVPLYGLGAEQRRHAALRARLLAKASRGLNYLLPLKDSVHVISLNLIRAMAKR